MLSDTKRKKYTHYFNILDHDQDGMLEREDFVTVARVAAALRGIEAESPDYVALEAAVLLTWIHTQEFADTDGNGKVTLDEWLQTLEATGTNEEKFATYATPWAIGFFDLIDADGDGVIGRPEYRAMLQCFRSDGMDSDSAFERLDSNKDGAISKEEAMQLVREFLMSDDPNAAGNWLFGPF
jgi:Ca2+-binding EF-hand superfamily protein